MTERSEEQGVLLSFKFSGICGRNDSIRGVLLESSFPATSLATHWRKSSHPQIGEACLEAYIQANEYMIYQKPSGWNSQ
jgi:hypothetical protein